MIKLTQVILVWISLRTVRFSIFGIAILYSYVLGCRSNKSSQDFDTVECNCDSVFFLNDEVKISLSARAWGIAGNHEQINIFSNVSSDTVKLFTSEAFYRKVGSDSLVVYAPQSAIPTGAKSKIGKVKVHLIGLNTHAEVVDYSTNYNHYGLTRISAINK